MSIPIVDSLARTSIMSYNYSYSRRVLEASLIKTECFPPYSIENFLYNPVSKPVSFILKFLKENNWFI